jgi:tetratricopeptide (TPR) repeat protein
VHDYYAAFYLLPLGRLRKSAEEMERALEQDPLNVLYRVQLAISLHAAGLHEQAIAEARKTLEIDPDYWAAHAVMARSYIASEMPWKGLINWRPGAPASLDSWPLHWSRPGTSSAPRVWSNN